ncbi:ATP-binding protein [Nocardioides cynanchi]|uniref:hybrid sensor histidine kinase/response regulator n=1 Tax=Nocardioides cynanchi TaxID=2558918 RepID=UPI00192D25AD|nr:ATP-binding protein [Nocardioides cynanchi]
MGPDLPTRAPRPGDAGGDKAREQAVATHEILVALSRAGADPGSLLDVIVERAQSLCGAQVGQLYLVEPTVIRLSRISGDFPEDFRQYVRDHPIARNRESMVGRAAVDRSSQRVDDVLADQEYGRNDLQQIAGYRSLLTAPMMLDDEVVGVLSMWRTEVDPFDDDAVATLGLFAAQAAIVLRQVDLLGALESRGAELATKVAQLEALRDVGVGVSSSLDLDEVLTRIVANAVHLTGADGGSVMEFDPVTETFIVRAAYGSSDRLIARLRSIEIRRDSTLVGQAAMGGQPLEVADLAEMPTRDPHLQALFEDGWRSALAVPVQRNDDLVGALVIRRRTPGLFDQGLRDLLRTFAGQSGLAIVNARLYGELDSQRRELEVASRHKSEFLASMSHELRTPLNAVIGFSEVLMDQMFGDLNERQAEYVRDIWSSGRHLLELLNEILDLSKVEAGQMVLEPARFSIRVALESALSMVRERAAAHAIALELDVGPGVEELDADELRFKQVVLNLVSNAVKFTPDGGAVAVSARRTGRDLVVAVRDTGPGIPEEDRERIFDSFQQGGRGAPKAEGTGLGLTLSRRIVQLFGGRLWLESEEGRGSTFTFSLPVYPALTADGAATTLGKDGRPTILLVEDDRASLDLMIAYLAGSPALVLTAHDGVEALEMARRSPPAAVVLDVQLPRMDGWQVLEELKGDPATAQVPVVVASIVDDHARGLALGASAYLTKPIGRADLLEALAGAGVLRGTDVGTGGLP